MFLFVLLTLTYIRTKQEKKTWLCILLGVSGCTNLRGDSLFSNVGYPVNICLENYSMECCDRKPVRFYSLPRMKFFFLKISHSATIWGVACVGGLDYLQLFYCSDPMLWKLFYLRRQLNLYCTNYSI